MRPARVFYPWLSTLAALAFVAWQFALANAALIPLERLPAPLRDADNLLPGAALLLLLVGFDIWLFSRASRRCRAQLEQYREQISELFETRRELGTRARTYSDHADKLKMFISERLLETIEYDEKFLHFKNIASEVRHNGVISYDKAQTALKRAARECAGGDAQQYREAADGLLYLWDLLDLSTTDNIALHVANQIYDCEEHYFEAQLNEHTEGAPFEPTFLMSHALRRALLPIIEDPDALGLNRDWPKRGTYVDDKFLVQLRSDGEMLGNENHMVLLIENLVNNALFYSQQKEHRNRFSRVAITLAQRGGNIEIRIYNRGPLIKEDEKDKIYQLGFSSRRIREHHGKGLGLYFVNEICKGFEGAIDFENIENREGGYALAVKLAGGEVVHHEFELVLVNGRPRLAPTEADAPADKRREWSYDAPIASIEASPPGSRKPQLVSGLAAGEDSTHLDAADTQMPRWVLEVKNRKRSSRLVFTPLDVRGVEFVASFETAGSRLDNQE